MVFNPYWIILFKTFAAYFFLTIIHVQMQGHFGMQGDDWTWYIIHLWNDEKALGLLLSAGVLISLFASKGITRGSALFITLMFLYIGSWAEKATRFIMILMPLASMVTAALLWKAAINRPKLKILIVAIVIAVFVIQTTSIYDWTNVTSQPDSRRIARAWIEEHIPARSRLLTDIPVPDLHSNQELEFIRKHLTSQGMNSVQDEYEKVPIYYIEKLSKNIIENLHWNQYDYVIIRGFDYDCYFDTSQLPPSDNPLHEEYIHRREFYKTLLSGKLQQSRIIAEFGGKNLYGPQLTIIEVLIS